MAAQAPCPSAAGVACLSLPVSSPPAPSDPFTLVAIDLTSRVYSSPAAAEAYARGALGAPAARFIANSTTDTQLLVAGGNDTILIVFRGSMGAADWDTNFDTNAEPTTFGAAGNASVHHGFLQAAESVYPSLVDTLREVDPDGRAKIYVAGHSLGSGLAQLTAAKLATDAALPPAWRNISGVYSFGGPRVGGEAWAEVYQNATGLGAKTLRVALQKDIVPLLPPTTMDGGFRHVGRTYILPLTADSCEPSAVEEYDACAAGAGAIDFDTRLGPGHACSSVVGAAGAAGFCASQGAVGAPGDALADADTGSGGGLVQLAGLLCSAVDIGTLAGSPCCALLETGVNTLTGAGQPLQFHYPNLYMAALAGACLGDCAVGQWRRCGGGAAAKDAEALGAAIPEDPAAGMAPEVANAGVDAIAAAFAAFGGGGAAPAPVPEGETISAPEAAPAPAASGAAGLLSRVRVATVAVVLIITH